MGKTKGGLKMKQVILAAALAIVATAAQAQGTNPNSHPVQAYTTLGPAGAGVYVEPHQHTNPNAAQTNNYGTRGNVNANTGGVGTRNPRN
jgi:hypothetical protein